MALKTIQEFTQTADSQARHAQAALWCFKGTDDEKTYVMEINPTTGQIPVTLAGILSDFGPATTAPRFASMIGGFDILPEPGIGAKGFTGTPLQKTDPNDGRALDVVQYFGFDGAKLQITQETATPANNRGLPIVLLAGQGQAPVAVDSERRLFTAPHTGLIPERFNAVVRSDIDAENEAYAFFADAAKTVLICTVTITYTDAGRSAIAEVVRS